MVSSSENARQAATARRTDRRVAKTDAAIRRAFEHLASQGDFRKISITALAKEADIDRKTFYLHYQSVDELVECLVRESAERMAADIQKALERHGGSANAEDLLRELMAYTPANADLWQSAAVHAPLEDMIGHLEKPLSDALVTLHRSHGPESDMDARRASYGVSFMVAGTLAMYKRWLVEQPGFPLEDLTEMGKAVTLAGLPGLARHLSEAPAPAR